MQYDLFHAPPDKVEKAPLELIATQDSGYRYRTGINASKADLTLACALNYDTAGERATRTLAGNKYLAIPVGTPAAEAAAGLLQVCQNRRAFTLNIAGNGVYTLAPQGWSQARINQWLLDILKAVHAKHPFEHIRSGGQTGLDQAGLVCAVALGIPATGLYPAGFKRRNVHNKDIFSTPKELEEEILEQAASLNCNN